MNIVESAPPAEADLPQAHQHQPLGLAVLLREAAAGTDLAQLGQLLLEHAQRHSDPYAMLDLSLVLHLRYQKASALAVQGQAIKMQRHYRLTNGRWAQPAIKVLALKAPGDLMTNTPFECLIENTEFQVDVIYVDRYPVADLKLPEHDVILVAACASDENAGFLEQMAALTQRANCRVLNRPEGIALTTRDAAFALLGQVPGIHMAHTVRMHREQVLAATSGSFGLSDVLDGDYPFIVRPVGSHAGQGLKKVSDSRELAQYVEATDIPEYFVAPFVNYCSADGLFRKYRIVMIDGRPFICHMGISSEWMVHYPYEEMVAHADRREEEAHLMATFDSGFAARHHDALRKIAELTGLDYVGFDCAETHDGRLLVFEIATAMVVHDMDDPATFPYKIPQMRRVFGAFQDMLRRAAADRVDPTRGLSSNHET